MPATQVHVCVECGRRKDKWRLSAPGQVRSLGLARKACSHLCNADKSLTSATSQSALWVENSKAPRDERHRWPAMRVQSSGRSVTKTDRRPLPKYRYSSFPRSGGVTRGSTTKRLNRFWVSSLCTPPARSDTSSKLSLLRISSGLGPCPRGPAHR